MYCFTLMNKGSIHTGKGKVIPKADAEVLMKSHELLEAAKEEAKAQIEAAHKECEELKEKAKKEGHEEGLKLFNTQILYFEEQLKVLRHEMQKAMLPLVLKATKRIVGEELDLNPESVINIVVESIKSVSQCQFVKLYVNRADLETLEAHKEVVKKIFDRLESFSIEERPDVTRGSCIIETEKGILNATLENQYRALERAFENYMKKR